MPPTGPRSRPSQTQGQQVAPGRPNTRNEVFENIFGRPAVAHHLTPQQEYQQQYQQQQPQVQQPQQQYYQSYGYGQQGQPQPQPQQQPGYDYVAHPPPRASSQSHRALGVGQPPEPVAGLQPSYPVGYQGYGQGPDPRQRRVSTAPSIAPSTHSSSSYHPSYNPQPQPPPGGAAPVPSRSTYQPSAYPDRARSVSNHSSLYPLTQGTAVPPPQPRTEDGLTPAQAYQRSEGYSPATHSRNPAPTLAKPQSPPPDYGHAMGSIATASASTGELWFDGKGGGPLDAIPGIPPRSASTSVQSETGQRRSTEPTSDFWEESVRAASAGRRPTDPSSYAPGPSTHAPSHRREPSDSSIISAYASGYGSSRQQIAPLSQIDDRTFESPYDSPTTPTGSDAGFAATAQRRLSARKSIESVQSLPMTGQHSSSRSSRHNMNAGSSSSMDNRATSFSGSSSHRDAAVAAVRSGSVGHGSKIQPPIPPLPPSAYNYPSPSNSMRSLSTQQATSVNRATSVAKSALLKEFAGLNAAFLSQVAGAFKQVIPLAERVKDGLTYQNSFDGREAVSFIAEIIKTQDRNLALLLGRALDAQKFFHDVTYDHRLRDTPAELYQFRERLASPFMPGEGQVTGSPSSDHQSLIPARPSSGGTPRRPSAKHFVSDAGSSFTSDSHSPIPSSTLPTPMTSTSNLSHHHGIPSPQLMTAMPSGTSNATRDADEVSIEEALPVGIFTLLTDCYSPTCSKYSLCYSINCPRRLEQMKRLNMKPQPGLNHKLSEESLGEVKETGTLWIHSVPQEIVDSVDDTEMKRQEAINEAIYTERDFVRDLEYLRDSWIKPLRTQEDIIPAARRDDFVTQVFWNVHEILAVNSVLSEKLTKRQKQQPIVSAIGDLYLERVPLFEPFVTYGAHQLFGKYEFEKEKSANPAFQKFVDETERNPMSRKLELNGYLTKPTTRLARYPLLLEVVLKYTPEGHPDKKDLPEVIKLVRSFLAKVNVESGKSENMFNLAQLDQQLVFRPGEAIDLRLKDKNRELVNKGPLKRRGGTQGENADLMVFLFDHALLLVKPKWVNKQEQYKVYRRPIPLELLTLSTPDEQYNLSKNSGSRAKLMPRPSATKSSNSVHTQPKPESKHGFSLTITHLGRKGYSMVLWAETYMGRKKWLEHIDKQQAILRERSQVFVTESITDHFFIGLKKVNCISPYDGGRRMIYGTDEGVYFSNLHDDKLREPVKVIILPDVTQVDVIEEFQLLIVLSERSVQTFPLDCLDPNDPSAALKRGKRISSHTSFFKSGMCLGKTLVCVVKSSSLSSTIKVLEPVDQSTRSKKPQTSFMKRLNGGNESLRVFKEFYIPTESSSIHFLKTKLCVGCTKGFEIVDLESLDTQGLLDPSDSSLDFVSRRENVRPISIYRVEGDFLLCYDEFAFYVNKNGWRARPKWAIVWEGSPTAFALHYPYVLAFEPSFVEVRNVESGHLVQIIPGTNVRCLFADTPPSVIQAPVRAPLHYPPVPQQRAPYGQPQMYPPYGNGQQPSMPPRQPTGYGLPMHPPPLRPANIRQQIIFVSEEGNVQVLKLQPPGHHSPSPSTQSNGKSLGY